MPRREVLVQLDDELVEQLDRIAKALGTSRSELLRRGTQAVIVADAGRANDIELIAAYKRQPPDRALIRSAARVCGIVVARNDVFWADLGAPTDGGPCALSPASPQSQFSTQ
jgi:metal-responsive CopG/Arc/MetJ family transcriptional regulator